MLVRTARYRRAVRVAERVRVREIEDDEGQHPLQIIRRGTGSVLTWRRAQVVLLSAQGMPVAKIAKSKPADFLVAEGVIDDISHKGLRVLLRAEGVLFQRIKTWNTSRDLRLCRQEGPRRAPLRDRCRRGLPRRRRAEIVVCLDEFGRAQSPTSPWTKNRTTFLAFCRYLRSLYSPQTRIAIVLDNFSPSPRTWPRRSTPGSATRQWPAKSNSPTRRPTAPG